MKKTSWILRGLHVMMGLALPFLILALTSCKRAKEEKSELGAEVSVDAVIQAFDDATTGASFSDIKAGQFIEYSIVQRVEGNETTRLLAMLSTGVRVYDEDTTKNQKKIIIAKTLLSRNASGGWDSPIVTEMDPICMKGAALVDCRTLTGDDSANAASATGSGDVKMSAGARKMQELQAYAAKVSGQEDTPPKTTFHNLRVVDGTLAAPDAVQNKPGCGGLPECNLPVRYIRFEMAAYNKEGTSYQKINLDFAVSRVTPFMPLGNDIFDFLNGLIVVDCRSTSVPIEGRRIYVRDCKQVENYQK